MDAFITGSSGRGHPWGCYLQAVRELSVRVNGLHATDTQIQLARLDLRELEGKLMHESNDIKHERLKIETQALRNRLMALGRQQATREEEARRFFGQAVALREHLGFPLGTEIPASARAQLDEDYWDHRIKCQIAMDMWRGTRVCETILDLVPTLPGRIRQTIIKAMEDSRKTIEWFHNIKFEVPVAKFSSQVNLVRMLPSLTADLSLEDAGG